MGPLIVLILCFTAVFGYNLETEWQNFKIKYGKAYANKNDELKRKQIFENNLKLIEDHNKKYEIDRKKVKPEITYTMKINSFTDLSYNEFVTKYSSKRKLSDCPEYQGNENDRRYHHRPSGRPTKSGSRIHESIRDTAPVEKDWTKEVGNTPVLQQGDCGCCWALATIGVIEYHIAIKRKKKKTQKFEELSAQELIDCVTDSGNELMGCSGAHQSDVYKYVMTEGITPLQYYPNRNPFRARTCAKRKMRDKKLIFGYKRLLGKDEEEMKRIIAFKGPVVAAMSITESVKNYGTKKENSNVVGATESAVGLYKDGKCRRLPTTHYVMVVGYGIDEVTGFDYWLIKNSWGVDWGERGGYMRLSRNRKNHCNIASEVYYPIV